MTQDQRFAAAMVLFSAVPAEWMFSFGAGAGI
jgi:hypothetical protein